MLFLEYWLLIRFIIRIRNSSVEKRSYKRTEGNVGEVFEIAVHKVQEQRIDTQASISFFFDKSWEDLRAGSTVHLE